MRGDFELGRRKGFGGSRRLIVGRRLHKWDDGNGDLVRGFCAGLVAVRPGAAIRTSAAVIAASAIVPSAAVVTVIASATVLTGLARLTGGASGDGAARTNRLTGQDVATIPAANDEVAPDGRGCGFGLGFSGLFAAGAVFAQRFARQNHRLDRSLGIGFGAVRGGLFGGAVHLVKAGRRSEAARGTGCFGGRRGVVKTAAAAATSTTVASVATPTALAAFAAGAGVVVGDRFIAGVGGGERVRPASNSKVGSSP